MQLVYLSESKQVGISLEELNTRFFMALYHAIHRPPEHLFQHAIEIEDKARVPYIRNTRRSKRNLHECICLKIISYHLLQMNDKVFPSCQVCHSIQLPLVGVGNSGQTLLGKRHIEK